MNQTNNNSQIEHSVKGKKGKALLIRKANGQAIVSITLNSGQKITASGERVNLRAMKAQSLAQALDKVCHGVGRVSLYQVERYNGPKASTTLYSSQDDSGETGYGLFLKKGKKALSFALHRLDLESMKSETASDAAKKAAYTGRIALINA
jgi:hypothetical protein